MSTLLSLPWELREQIWIFALQRDVPVRRPRSVAHYELNRPTTTKEEIVQDNVASLLCTCRQVEEEAAPIFYGMNDICPYFSRYVDQADYKGNAPWVQSLPFSHDWDALPDADKYQALGLSPKYSRYIVSIVLYNDAIKGLAFDYALVSRSYQSGLGSCNAERTSDLLAEMLFWVRLKAPQIQSISVRYRMHTTFHLYGYIIDCPIAQITHLEPRFWRAVKRFPHLRILEFCTSHAKPKIPHQWGQSCKLFTIPEDDHRVAKIRSKFIGPSLMVTYFRYWLELDRAEEEIVQCGMRWVFLVQPKATLKDRSHNSVVHLRSKTNVLTDGIYPNGPEAQGTFLRLSNARRNKFTTTLEKNSDQVLIEPIALASNDACLGTHKPQETLWIRIQSLSPHLKSSVWRHVLRRSMPLHWCYDGCGNPLITALLRVNHQTYREGRFLFVQENTFSVNPLQLPYPFALSADHLAPHSPVFNPMRGIARPGLFTRPPVTVKNRLGALRSLRFYMAQPIRPVDASPLATRFAADGVILKSALDLLLEAAPLLMDLSITHYTEVFHDPNEDSRWPWHHNMMSLICQFRHLRRFTLLTCAEKSMLIGVPWQQRLAELDQSNATVSCQRTSDALEDCIPHEVLPSDSNVTWDQLPRIFVRNRINDILKPLSKRWLKIRVHFWPFEDLGFWDGTAWIVDLAPPCALVSEDHVCQGGERQFSNIINDVYKPNGPIAVNGVADV